MKFLHKIAFLLLLIGGLNWGVYALFGWEIGSLLGGMDSFVAKIIYLLVGLSAIYELVMHKGRCRECGSMKGGSMPSQSMGGSM